MATLSTTTKTVAAAVISVFAATILLGWLSLCNIQASQDILFSAQRTLATNVAEDVDRAFLRARRALTAVADLIEPYHLESPATLLAFLDNRVGIKSMFEHGICADLEGRLLCSGPATALLLTQPNRDWQNTSPWIGPQGIAAHAMAAPAMRAGRDITLWGLLDVRSPMVMGDLGQIHLGRSGYAFLVAPTRLMVWHPDPERVLQPGPPPGADVVLDRALAGDVAGSGETVDSRGVTSLVS
jgi:hypothetical protein